MKILLLFILLFSSSVKAKTYFFINNHETSILNAVDSICGDTWCEGEYDFKFTRFKCWNTLPSRCELQFEMFDRNYTRHEDEGFDSSMMDGAVFFTPTQARCSFKGIKGLSSIGTYKENGKFDLNEKFYENITSCIFDIERALAQ